MNEMTAVFEERKTMRENLLGHRIPKRVPIYPKFTLEAACSHAGVSLMEAHYNPELREKAYESICRDFYSDSCPVQDQRYPAAYQILGARNWVLGSNGAAQHPEIETMFADDYDDFIADPYTTMVEKFLPRVCTGLGGGQMQAAITMGEAWDAQKKAADANAAIIRRLTMKHGYYFGVPAAGRQLEAPFDFLADQLRGFKGINMDVRRIPEKVKAACEALVPLMVRQGTPATIVPGMLDFIPFHMAPYVSRKVFDELYWPTLLECVVQLDKMGIGCGIHGEQDWTRYLDALCQLPESTVIYFENGNYAEIKKQFGKNHVIGGFYDPTITLVRSREDCIDEAKRLVETCMEGGRYFFSFDRGVMDDKSIDPAKLAAVLDWVRDNAVY